MPVIRLDKGPEKATLGETLVFLSSFELVNSMNRRKVELNQSVDRDLCKLDREVMQLLPLWLIDSPSTSNGIILIFSFF